MEGDESGGKEGLGGGGAETFRSMMERRKRGTERKDEQMEKQKVEGQKTGEEEKEETGRESEKGRKRREEKRGTEA